MKKLNSEKLVKSLQIMAYVFIVAMAVAGFILMKKYNISVKNAAAFKDLLQGNVLTVALIIIVINFVKAFALVITPSLIFVICGIVFEDLWVAILVSMICIATSIPVPFFLGKFMGQDMAEKLKNKYPKIKKLDKFALENQFMVVFLVKASGLIPSDVSSMLLGAMGISFRKFFWATNVGEIMLIVLWCVLGNKGNFSDPKTFLYALPVIAFAFVASFVMKKWTEKKSAEAEAAQPEIAEAAEE